VPPVRLRARHGLVRQIVPLRVSTIGIHVERGDEQLRHWEIPVVAREVVRQRGVDRLLFQIHCLVRGGQVAEELRDLVGVEACGDVDGCPAVLLAVEVDFEFLVSPLDDVYEVLFGAEIDECLGLGHETVAQFDSVCFFQLIKVI